MPGGIHDVLFRLVGDETDARQALDRTVKELEAFARIHSTATADVDGIAESRIRLDQLKGDLEELDRSNTDPKIETDIAGVLAQLAILQAELDRMDGEDVNIDINVRKDIFDRIQSLTAQTGLLSKAAKEAEDTSVGLFERLGKSGVNVGGLTTQLKTFIPIAFAALGVIASIVGGIAALVGSLAEAAAGVGALAVALGGALVPGIGVAIIAIKDFKDNMDEAGTVAAKLKNAVEGIGEGFDLSKIAQPVERGALSAVNRLKDLNIGRILSGPLQRYAQGAGDAIRAAGRIIFRPKVAQEWADIIRKSAALLPSLGKVAGSVIRLLTNIADAAMPFLVRAVQGFAEGVHNITKQTDNISRLRAVIRPMINNLEAWLDLMKNIASVFIGFVRAVAPQGRKLVKWLSEGAAALADWTNSEEGREKIRQFLQRVMPLFKDLVTLVGRVVVVLLLLGEAMAPVFEPIVKALNVVLGLFIKFLDFMTTTQHGLSAWGTDAKAIWDALGVAAKAAWEVIKDVVGFIVGLLPHSWKDLLHGTTRYWDLIKLAILTPFRFVRDQLKNIWGFIKGIFVDAWNAILGVAKGPKAQAIRDVILAPFRFVRDKIGEVWGGIKDKVRDGIDAISSVARDAWNGVVKVADKIWSKVSGVVTKAARGMARILGRIWGGLADAWGVFATIIGGIGGAIATAFRNTGKAIRGAINWIIQKVNRAIDLLGALKEKIPIIGGDAPSAGDIISKGTDIITNPGGALANALDIHFQRGGTMGVVPGRGDGDKVSVMAHLEPGELFGVINKRAAAFVEWINGAVPRMAKGGVLGVQRSYPMLSGDLDFLPALGAALSRMAQATGQAITVSSGYRSLAEQQALYAAYQAGTGNLAAAPGTSEHETGAAADISPGRETFGNIAGKFGLGFTVPSESWHIALLNAAAGAVTAMVKMIPKLKFNAPGVFGNIGQGITDRVREAANNMIGRLQPKVMAGAGASVAAGAFSLAQLAALWIKAGGPAAIATLMGHIALAESGGDPNARNDSGASGLWQILGQLVPGNIFNPMVNALNAVAKYKSQGLGAWAASQASWGQFLADGIRNFAGGMAIVGENGPELLHLAAGSDVHSSPDSQRIIRRMADSADARGLEGFKLLLYGDFIPSRPDPVEGVLGDRRFPIAVERVTGSQSAHRSLRDRMNRG